MNKSILFLMLFLTIIIFSTGSIQASDINATDYQMLAGVDDTLLNEDNETQFCNLESDNSNEVLNENTKNQTELSSPTKTVYYKGDYSIALKDSNSSIKLSNKTVNLVINNINYNTRTNDDGFAIFNLNLAPGRYSVFASFAGDDSFNSCNFNSNVEILPTIKAADVSKYYKGSTKYGATFYDSHGNYLSNRWVTISVNGKAYSQKTNNNGVVSLAVNLKPGNYKIVSYDPDTGYSVTTNFMILSTISSSNLNKIVGDGKKFTAKFFKSNGKPLAKKYIKFKIKGKVYKVKTSKKGFASFSLKKFKKGTYKIVCYNKDGLRKTYKIKVFKRKVSTRLTSSSYIFYPNENRVVTAKFFTALADKSCSGKVIKIKVNGKTYSKKTDGNGQIYFDLSFLKKGVFTVEYKYKGNKFFKPSSTKRSVTIYDTSDTTVKVSGKSSFGQGAGTVLKVSYTAGGVPLPKRTVNLNINGETYTRTTDNNGIASVIPIDFDIGRYAVNYETDDESKFHGTSGSFDINVFKRSPSKITWKSGSSFKDKSQTFKVLATGADGNRASGGSVELEIDGETYYAKVSSKGYATVKTSVAIGKYKVAFAFEGNNEYLSSDYNHKTINVKLSKFGKGLNQKNAVGLKAYLKSSSHCKVGTKKIKALVKSLTKGLTSKVDKAKAIFNYVRDTLDYSYYYDTKYGASGTLKHKTGNCVDHSHLLVSMFRTAGLHARYVHGKCHFKSGGTTGHVWTQVKIGKTWVCADAVSYRNSLGKINNWYTKSYTVHNTYSSLPF